MSQEDSVGLLRDALGGLRARDGTPLHVQVWGPEGDIRFAAVLVHGNAEHIGRYGHVAERLAAGGGLVFGADARGQGRSGGRRGHVDAFENYSDDLMHVVRRAAEELPAEHRPDRLPWFVYGHSTGGLIGLLFLLDHGKAVRLRGAIIASPLLGLTMKVNPIKLFVGKVAAQLLPKLALPSDIPDDAICRDPVEVRKYTEDPHRAKVVTARWFDAMNGAIDRAEREVGRLDLPMLWMVGTADRICDHEAAIRVFERLADPGSRDQELRKFEGYFHELHNEPAELREPVLQAIVDWMVERAEQ